MDEITMNQKYQEVLNNLNRIINYLDNIGDNNNKIYQQIKNNLLIDEEPYNAEYLNSLSSDIKQIHLELINEIIPKIKSQLKNI